MTTNHLIDAIPVELLDGLPLTTVALEPREVLQHPGAPSDAVYFPLSAVLSVISTMTSGASAEVALVGREGLVGIGSILGSIDLTTSAVVLLGGTALQARGSTLRRLRTEHAAIRELIDLYIQSRLMQVAQSVACNRLHPLDARLARWLLMVHDRIEADQFTVSQEVIAHLVGAHRPTIAAALSRLDRQDIVKHAGRALFIADRRRLEAAACECYRVVQDECNRLLHPYGSTVTPAHDEPARVQVTTAVETVREIAGRLLLASIREQQAREAAEAASRAKDDFLAMVSHELRTPLNAILGWCALPAGGDSPSTERRLEVIERNARAQLALVDDLLDAARITTGTLAVRPAPVNLPELVIQATNAVKPLAEQKNVALHLQPPPAMPTVRADAERVQQVLLNVLANAIKFTAPAGSVSVQVHSTASVAQIVVRDTGVGIAPQLLPHVFERFRQGPVQPEKRSGVGLGLTISRALIELHGGAIHLDSEGEGKGTTCTIDLPITPSAVPAPPSARP